jgi:uncharacterized coiled-coil protein SlyX
MAEGKIITFYSYKGGAGRSMCLANVAWILASGGKRVLALDWDLEAPGLHRYFYPFLVDRNLTDSEGVIDLILDYSVAAMTPPAEGDESQTDWFLPHANILRYATSLDWPHFAGQGRLDFIPAGRQGPSYSTRVNSFDWQDFYGRLGGWAFLEAVKQKMRAEYDYVLIDSRTGVSDTSGICTVQMPDTLVVCYLLNNQSIDGAAAVAASVYEQRQKALRVLPVAMRVESTEKDKRDARREYALGRFAHYLEELKEKELYRGKVQFPYIPYYAYEEILATFGDKAEDTNTLLESVERLTLFLTDGEVAEFKGTHEAARRKEILAAYAKLPGASRESADTERERQGFAAVVARRLARFARAGLRQRVPAWLALLLVTLLTASVGLYYRAQAASNAEAANTANEEKLRLSGELEQLHGDFDRVTDALNLARNDKALVQANEYLTAEVNSLKVQMAQQQQTIDTLNSQVAYLRNTQADASKALELARSLQMEAEKARDEAARQQVRAEQCRNRTVSMEDALNKTQRDLLQCRARSGNRNQ